LTSPRKLAAPAIALLLLLLPLKGWCQLNTDYYLQKGRQLLYYYKYSRAIESFNTVLEYKPDHAEAYFLRGIAKYNLQDYYGAEQDYTRAIRYKSNSANAFYYRGMTRIQLYNFQGAINDFNQTLYFINAEPDLYIQRGYSKLRLEKYQQAIEDFNKALSRSNNLRKAYYYRAITKLNLNDTTSALEDLSTALQIDSTYTNAYISSGRIRQQKNQYGQALEDLNKALYFDPNNSRALTNRSMVYYHLDQIDQAKEDLDHLIRNEPANALAYYNRALLQSNIGAYDEAISDYNKVLEYNPQNILTYFNRGLLHMKTGAWGKAIKDFTLAIRLYPNFAKAYINRATARRKLQDYQGAQADQEKARQITQAYRDNQLEKVNFADTSENFRRLISLQNSQNLPRHFGNIQESIEPRDIFSLYFQSNNQQNLARLITRHLKKQPATPTLSYLDKNFVLDTRQSTTHPPEFYHQKITSLTDSIDQHAEKAKYYVKRALMKERVKNYNGALDDLNAAARLMPDHYIIPFLRGNIRNKMTHYIKMMQDDAQILNISLDDNMIKEPVSREVSFHDYKKAIDDYDQSIKLAPRFVYSYYNRANTRIQNKNYKGAINDYNKAIFLDEEFARAYFNRGLTYIYLQQTTRGCIDISKAGELGMDEAYTVIKLYCQ